MPNVIARPRTLENGRTLTQFTDTTSTSTITYTYPTQQTGLQIENSGEKDLTVTVGSYTQTVKADTKWKVDTSFTSFTISSVVDSQEFIATSFVDIVTDLSVITSQLADIAKQKGYQDVVTKMIKGQTVNIVCYGDSITYGYVPSTGVQTTNPYPVTLQSLLQDFYKNTNITVFNEGYSGRQSDEFASDTYIGYVTRHTPDLVIFMCGINDNNGNSYGPVTTITDYIANLETVRKKLNVPMILLTPTPTFGYVGTSTVADDDKKDRIQTYVETMKKYGVEKDLPVVDLNKGIYNYYHWRLTDIYTAEPDITHYIDDYYKHIAEYVFANSFTNTDIIVREEKFYPAIHSVFNFIPQVPRYFESSANPEHWNVLLQSTNPTASSFIYVFIDKPSVDFIPLLAINVNGSNSNEIVVDGVTYSVSGYALSTMWNIEKYICNLKYGLHKITFNAKTGANGKTNFMINGLKFVLKDLDRGLSYQTFTNMDVKQSKKLVWQGLEYINANASTAGWMYRELLTLDSKGNKHYRLFMEMTEYAGFGLGKYEVKNTDGTIIKAPLQILYQGGSVSNFSVMSIPLSTDTAFQNLFSGANTIKAGTLAKFTAPTFVIVDIFIDSTKVDYYVNGILAVSVNYTDTVIGELVLWTWVFGDGTATRYTKLFKIEELPYTTLANQFDIGDEYFDSVAKVKKIYDGAAWKTVTMA